MDLNFFQNEFNKLLKKDEKINYIYEPRFNKKEKIWRRHFFYKELKKDFSDEVSSFGFSPFIKESFCNQRKDKNIMKFKKDNFEFGLLNYVQRKNKNYSNKSINNFFDNDISKISSNYNNSDRNPFLGKAFFKIKNKKKQIRKRNFILTRNIKNNIENYDDSVSINYLKEKDNNLNKSKVIKTIFNNPINIKSQILLNKNAKTPNSNNKIKIKEKFIKHKSSIISQNNNFFNSQIQIIDDKHHEFNEKIKLTMFNRYKKLKDKKFKRNIQLIRPLIKDEDSIAYILNKSLNNKNIILNLKSFQLKHNKFKNNFSNIIKIDFPKSTSNKIKFLENIENDNNSIFKKALNQTIKKKNKSK